MRPTPETMPADDAELRAALDALASARAAEILDRARIEAESRVHEILVQELTEALLHRVRHPAAPDAGAPDAAAPDAAAPAAAAPAEPVPASDAPAAARTPDPRSQAAGAAVYVYGIIAADGGPAPDMIGVDNHHPVHTLTAGELTAVVSRVSLHDFDEQALHDRLGDLDWVARVARTHEAVLEAVAAETAVVPMRLCSIYHDEAGVAAMLTREAARFAGALRQLDGAAEWGVKMFAASVNRAGEPVPEAETGAEYLRRRNADQHARGQADAELAGLCETVHHRLSELSAGSRVLAVHRREVSGHAGEMILNGAYLVPREQTDAFHEAVTALTPEAEGHGVEIELTGPWPAYNFVGDQSGATP